MGAKTKYGVRNRYTFGTFRYKNGDCIENDYYAVSGPSGASDCRGSFVSRCRITPVPLGRSGSDRRAFYRVTGADLASLANLRLRAEAQYSSALLHSPRPLLMPQVSTSEVKCGRPPSLQQKVQRAVSLILFATGALEQPYKPVGFVVAAGVKYSSSDSHSLLADRKYGHKVDSGQKLFQFAF
jgi:hypothetical protein